MLLRQFINISNYVSSTVKQVFPENNSHKLPMCHLVQLVLHFILTPNVRIIVSLNKTTESSKCLQVTATSGLMASRQCLHYDLKPHL